MKRMPADWLEESERTGMAGNATYRYRDTAIVSVAIAEAPIVVTSKDFDEQLAESLAAAGLRPGMLEALAGISERRWWPEDVSFADAAAMAGAKAIAEAGVDPDRIGLLINTSVCRDHLEPSASVDVHQQLGLSSACQNFDLANACLGFLNGMQLAATMIDAGQIEYALIVDGEGSRLTQQRTIERLQSPDTTKVDLLENFATLTLGSGAAAMVLGRASDNPGGHRFVGGVGRAATQHHQLCIGDLDRMITDSKGLLEAGVQLAVDAWTEASSEFDWSDLQAYVIHQVSQVHTQAITSALGIDPERTPIIFPTRGNIGPASIPFTLALFAPEFSAGDRIACMGIGSGLNAAVIEIEW
ncbi:MAG: 3-oxoacyl-ACP synthase III [Candidatus Nanopelagicales bacterium]|nr:3-oxoacyl-ACP synthase III [Candidatus Nanopelagicales bacterium]MCF8537223.1 3-oxoacyl-ACP synthase III [Candidatus Nanopelagicales bacterium]MCF8558426.1 3-oxoacyl-ACP synthase III [Candidatus Nanopelagicales bacterium]